LCARKYSSITHTIEVLWQWQQKSTFVTNCVTPWHKCSHDYCRFECGCHQAKLIILYCMCLYILRAVFSVTWLCFVFFLGLGSEKVMMPGQDIDWSAVACLMAVDHVAGCAGCLQQRQGLSRTATTTRVFQCK